MTGTADTGGMDAGLFSALRSLALFFFLGCGLCRAEVYYSDPAASPGGDGSAGSPWPGLEMLARGGWPAKLKGGDTLLLRSGNHGNAVLAGDQTQTLTVAAEEGQKPVLGRLTLTKGSRWLFKGLTISSSFSPAPYKGHMVTLAEGGPSSDLVLEDCFVYTALDNSSWSPQDWMAANDGVFLGRHGKNLVLRNTYLLNTRFAVNLASPDSLCEGNIIRNFSGDGIRITRDNITVQDNIVCNAFVGPEEGDDNHDDLIQCFLFNVGTGTVRNVTVRDNLFVGQEKPNVPHASMPQGVGFFDGPLLNFIVQGNVVETNHWHGISLYDAVHCRIEGNVARALTPQKMLPWIMLGTKNKGGCSENRVLNNRAHSFNLRLDPGVENLGNEPVKDGDFERSRQELEGRIVQKFGKLHSVSGLPRLVSETVN